MRTIIQTINHNIRSADMPIRVFHGRGNCYAGFSNLCIDFYLPVAHIICFAEPGAGFIEELSEQLLANFPDLLEGVVVQHRYGVEKKYSVVCGNVTEKLFACEDGLRFQVNLARKQNVGFFSDMRLGRRLVREIAQDKNVLNLFAYTCSFSVAALAGGARSVVNVDMNKKMLAIGRENHCINGLDLRKCSFLNHNIFKSFAKLAKLGPYQLIVIDPPTFQLGSFQIKKDYPKILRRIPSLCHEEVDIIATINEPFIEIGFFEEIIEQNLPGAVIVDQFGAPAEFVECGKDVVGLKVFHIKFSP